MLRIIGKEAQEMCRGSAQVGASKWNGNLLKSWESSKIMPNIGCLQFRSTCFEICLILLFCFCYSPFSKCLRICLHTYQYHICYVYSAQYTHTYNQHLLVRSGTILPFCLLSPRWWFELIHPRRSRIKYLSYKLTCVWFIICKYHSRVIFPIYSNRPSCSVPFSPSPFVCFFLSVSLALACLRLWTNFLHKCAHCKHSSHVAEVFTSATKVLENVSWNLAAGKTYHNFVYEYATRNR